MQRQKKLVIRFDDSISDMDILEISSSVLDISSMESQIIKYLSSLLSCVLDDLEDYPNYICDKNDINLIQTIITQEICAHATRNLNALTYIEGLKTRRLAD